MKTTSFVVLLLTLPFAVFSQTAKDIVKKSDERARGKTSFASVTIETVRPTWKREMSLKVWTKGNDFSLIFVTSPAKDKGIVFLKRQKEVWNWIPSIDRNIKLPPSMMNQSWMGTDFTNDDLVKEASIVEDYGHTMGRDSMIDNRACYKIELKPKPTASVVWGKINLWIDKKDYLMLNAEYFDEDNVLVNQMRASEVKILGGRLLPSRMEMIPIDKKGNKTVLIYKSLEFDKAINDSFFSTNNMSKVR